jgi:eukaryotic-like serine/threonine-protein kinase
MDKVNCWEFMKCGREYGGARENELTVCPAFTETRVNGMHGGKNGGRVCWAIAGTLCLGQVRGTYAGKMSNCLECSFYMMVKDQEKRDMLKVNEIRAAIMK